VALLGQNQNIKVRSRDSSPATTQKGGKVVKSLNLNMESIIDDSDSNADPDKALETLQTYENLTFDKGPVKGSGVTNNTFESECKN
jgi:hypothetical protein